MLIRWQDKDKLVGHFEEWQGKLIVGSSFPPYAEVRKQTQAGTRLSLFVGSKNLPTRIVGGGRGNVRLALKSVDPIMFEESEIAELIDVILETQKKLATHDTVLSEQERNKFLELRQHLGITAICRALKCSSKKLEATRKMYPEWADQIAGDLSRKPSKEVFASDVELLQAAKVKTKIARVIGKKYGVTPSTVLRWARLYEIGEY